MPTKSTTKAKKASKKTSSKKAQSKKTTSKKKTSAVSNLKKAVEKNTPKTSAASNKKAVTRKSVQKTAQAIRDAAKKMGQKSAKPSNKKVSKSTEVDFKVGDRAVYPAHGVGVIERIDNKEISGVVVSFYVMRILDNDMMVMIPKSNAKHAGLREIIPSRRVGKVFKVFEDQKEVKIDTTTWNRRYRDYMEKIKTGSVLEIA
ncbi:MAG: hypothetical protein KDD52_06525, partial [Bdellovibrionales bacterium]|nr:hypothetical protein [Bdellovibrionales bacterium]